MQKGMLVGPNMYKFWPKPLECAKSKTSNERCESSKVLFVSSLNVGRPKSV